MDRRCASPGCEEAGEHKAPLSRDQLREYQFLCMNHIREFNRKWNYFEGMEGDEIEAFMQDSLTGHRPTWQREEALTRRGAHRRRAWGDALEEGLARFFHWDEDSLREEAKKRIPPRERKALVALELDTHCSLPQLKAHYRTLVKRYHPDLHRGDREYEEKFKHITQAYRFLVTLYEGRG